MKHRHLLREDFTLAAIDDILDRGGLADWAPLLREIRRDPHGPVAGRVAQVLEHHTMYGTTRAWARFLQVEQSRGAGPVARVELTPGTRPSTVSP
jgi:hypothetical protein